MPAPSRPEDAALCEKLLTGGKIVGKRMPPVVGIGGCGIPDPILLSGVVVPDGRVVALEPAALLRCDLAGTVADWVRDAAAPAAPEAGELVAVSDAAAYDCRGRNHAFGGIPSEHSTGNAIDVLAFRFKTRSFGVVQSDSGPFWSTIKASACARFTTVLGPGSDSFHHDNLHVDLRARRNGLHICQWGETAAGSPEVTLLKGLAPIQPRGPR